MRRIGQESRADSADIGTMNPPAFEGPGWRRIHRRRRLIGASAICGALALLAATFEPGSLRAESEPPTPPEPSLGELWSAGYIVRIVASADEVRYTILDRSGRVLATALTAEDVARDYPELDPAQLRSQSLMTAEPIRPSE